MQTDKSATLSTHNTQTLFEPIPIADKATRNKGGGNTRKDDGAGNGLGVGEPGAPAYTLTAADRHVVACPCYSIDDMKMQNTYVWEEQANTLSARDYKGAQAVAYAIDRAAFNQGANAQYNISIQEELAQTLVAKGPGGSRTRCRWKGA